MSNFKLRHYQKFRLNHGLGALPGRCIGAAAGRRIHQTLRVTPAMEAGISDHVWSLEEIVGLLP
jgi:hypothetical protein